MKVAFLQLAGDFFQRGFAEVADFEEFFLGPRDEIANGRDPFGFQAVRRTNREFEFGERHVELALELGVDASPECRPDFDRTIIQWDFWPRLAVLDKCVQVLP